MEENKTFEITGKFEILDPEEVINEYSEVETAEEPEEEKKSNLPNMLLAGAAIVGIATAGYKIFNKVKSNRIKKELESIKKELIVELTGIVLPIVFYGAWLKMGFQFEKEGIITSQTFKGFIGKFKPSK